MIDRHISQERLNYLWILAYAAALVFLLRLINLQVLMASHYREIADKNRTQIIAQVAPRGRIFTSDDIAVATNKPSFSLIYFPGQLKTNSETDALASGLARQLALPYEALRNTLFKSARMGTPMHLAENISSKNMLSLSELKSIYPGVDIIVEARRFYPFGAYLSHLIGYIGKMDPREWSQRGKDKNYSMDSRVGKTGLEKMYETELKGLDGGIYLEVDSRGRLSRRLESREWASGADIYLTINSKAQMAAEEGLAASATGKGAVVALDPRSGAVLALVSMPDYDPNIFVAYQEDRDQEKLKNLPEFNVALQGTYPPASPFKIITSAALLETGKVSVDETFNCPGYYDAGSRKFKCWEKKGHGKMDFLHGLAHSCDVYYYNAALRVGPLNIEKKARQFRLGLPTGISLPDEKSGNVFGPSQRAAKKSYWFIGDTLNLAIGQGETLVTPIQTALVIAAVANGGIFHRPYYVNKIVNREGVALYRGRVEELSRLNFKDSTWDLLRQGLRQVVDEGTGQAAKTSGIDVYGKTGTAQNPQGKDHAWFVAYAALPGQPAEVAVSVLVEHGEHGASAAAPIAKMVIEALFKNKLPSKAYMAPAPSVKLGTAVPAGLAPEAGKV
ncbi:MAG: penicillin-binding protein 2 [Elusimicrobia bacterium GWC2_51_8]|nr:MAG: penicillin-binding protein 2 [Elusimicrobia bacterium GWC2_51_8]